MQYFLFLKKLLNGLHDENVTNQYRNEDKLYIHIHNYI